MHESQPIDTSAAIKVAALREALRTFMRESELIAREQSQADGRLAILRLTPEGEDRLARSFHAHEGERKRLHEMLDQLTD